MRSKISAVYLIFILTVLFTACNRSDIQEQNKSAGKNAASGKDSSVINNFKIEFVELGSVNCIPCKKMQPIMKSIETKYKGQVKVTFHDVWKDDAPAKKFGIDLIPTQVFLDVNGKEIMRHQGFYPEKDIDEFLQSQGLILPQ